jgi:hypothetical protein
LATILVIAGGILSWRSETNKDSVAINTGVVLVMLLASWLPISSLSMLHRNFVFLILGAMIGAMVILMLPGRPRWG